MWCPHSGSAEAIVFARLDLVQPGPVGRLIDKARNCGVRLAEAHYYFLVFVAFHNCFSRALFL